MTLMNPEIKASWIAALRSGEYQQGLGVLRSSDNKYCCLGVLCDLAAKAGIGKWAPAWYRHRATAFDFDFDGDYQVLPPSVQDWAGLMTPNGEFGIKDDLAGLNDTGFPFAAIADIIEANF